MRNNQPGNAGTDNRDGFYCLKCGRFLKSGTKFCIGCGTPVRNPSENITNEKDILSSAAPVSEDVCPQCGRALKTNAKFCGGCGFSFVKKEEKTEQPKEPADEKTLCPKCGAENNNGMMFCTACGGSLTAPAARNVEIKYIDVYSEDAGFCLNCGTKLKPGLRFCSGCGKPVDSPKPTPAFDPVPPKDYDPQKAEVNTIEESFDDEEQNFKKKHSKAPLIIGITIVAVILITAALVVWLFRDKIFQPEETPFTVETVIKNIEENSKKQIVDYKLDDFNGDGKQEAFVLVGTSDKKNGEINNADLWYTDSNETKEILKNFTGHSNGIINTGISKYYVVEVLDADENEEEKTTEKEADIKVNITDETKAEKAQLSHTFIYCVVNESFDEAEISDKYVNVHQDGDRIICSDEKGNSFEIRESEKKWSVTQIITPEEQDKGEALTTTQVEQFESMFTSLIWNIEADNPEGFDSLKLNDAYKSIIGAYCNVYYTYFDDEVYSVYNSDGAVKDPRNKLCSPNGKPDDKTWFAYVKRNADNVEWILKNILNVSPDRSRYDEGALSADGFEYYLEDGYYYTETGKYNDEAAVYELKDYEFVGDNKYTLYLEDTEGTAPKYTAVSELKEIDGTKYLTLISVKKDK